MIKRLSNIIERFAVFGTIIALALSVFQMMAAQEVSEQARTDRSEISNAIASLRENLEGAQSELNGAEQIVRDAKKILGEVDDALVAVQTDAITKEVANSRLFELTERVDKAITDIDMQTKSLNDYILNVAQIQLR